MRVKVRIPEIALGALLAVLIFAMGFLIGSSRQSPMPGHADSSQKGNQEQQPYYSPFVRFWHWTTKDAVTFYTLILTAFTGVLAGVGWIQIKQTRILQRAYLAVTPLGIRQFRTKDKIVGLVRFRNAGRLPARNISWFLDLIPSPDGRLADSNFPMPNDLHYWGNIVLAPDTSADKGTNGLDNAVLDKFRRGGTGRDRFLYVWGCVRYDDGFGNQCFTRFCHRYNLAASADGYSIGIEDARHHEHGNSTEDA